MVQILQFSLKINKDFVSVCWILQKMKFHIKKMVEYVVNI